ncbi:MAG TPA: GvpL/GvpF family gas vesicle protein [Conexibacter sp.]|jgi:hypothetical protein
MAKSTDTLTWVYGVLDTRAAPTLPHVDGVDGAPVALVERGTLAALASEVPRVEFDERALPARLEQIETLAALARAHDGVLEAALRAGADVVPFRMCTLYSGPDAIRGMIAHDAAGLERTLDRVRGMAEWGVKATLAAGPGAGAAGAADAAGRGGAAGRAGAAGRGGAVGRAGAAGAAGRETARSGTEYLARRRREREERERTRESVDAAVAELHARLASQAAAAVLSRPHGRSLTGSDAEMVLNGSYLVPRDAGDRFAALFEQLASAAAADGLALQLTGPWPPYHFVGAPEEERVV